MSAQERSNSSQIPGSQPHPTMVPTRSWRCKACGLDFDATSKRDNHHRLVHQLTVRVTYAGGEEVVLHRRGGFFACARTLCPYTSINPKRMTKHGKSCRATSGARTPSPARGVHPSSNAATTPTPVPGVRASSNAATTPTPVPGVRASSNAATTPTPVQGVNASPNIATTPSATASTSAPSIGTLLERLGLAMSHELKMLICQDCGVTIPMLRSIPSHIKQHHPSRRPHLLDLEDLRAELSQLGLHVGDSLSQEAVELCTPGLELRPVVAGLPLKEGHQCTVCFKSYASKQLCKNHQRNKHGQADPMKIRAVRFQTLGQGPGMNVNFVVDDAPSTPSTGTEAPRREAPPADFALAAKLVAQAAKAANVMQIGTADGSRDWPPYFQFLEWPQMVRDLDRSQADIDTQFRLPGDSSYGGQLRNCASRLMKQIQKGIEMADRRLLRKIKSPGLTTKLQLKLFSRLQESGEDYASFLANWIHFVLGAVRGAHHFLELREGRGRAECLRLYEHLLSLPQEGGDAEEQHGAAGTELLHDVLRSIFLRVRPFSELECNEICYRSIFLMSVAKPQVLTARDVTPKMSRFMYWIRGIVLLAVNKMRADLESGGGDSSQVAQREAREAKSLLQFCSDERPCPFASIAEAKTILRSFSASENVSDWLILENGDPRVILLEGKRLPLKLVGVMIRTLTQELYDELRGELMLEMPYNEQQIMMSLQGDMVDRVEDGRYGYSFLDESANFCYSVRSGLSDWILNNTPLATKFVQRLDERGMPVWRCSYLKTWFKACSDWIRKLMVVLHLVTGLPGRATEVAEYRYRNTQSNRRTLYISKGQAMFRPTYFKSNSNTGIVKHLLRFADAKTSSILVTYLTFVRPMEVLLCEQMYGPQSLPLYNSFIFVDRGRKISAESFGAQLKKVFADRMGVKLGVSKWRQVVVYWAKECCPEDRPSAVLTALHQQAGHTRETADHFYGRSGDEFLQANAHSSELFRRASSSYHSMLELNVLEVNRDSGAPGMTVPTHTIRPLVPASCGCSDTITGSASSSQVTNDSILCTRAYKECAPEVKLALKSLGHPGFKSEEQGEAMHRVLDRRHDILVVLPTGGGKTLLFQLAALLEPHRMQIVICPFRALTNELIRRCRQVGLKVMRWGDPDCLPNLTDCHMLFVAMEQVNSRSLIDELAKQHSLHRVSRYVMDECHVLILDRQWRQSTNNVWQFRKHDVPLLLLSGSLPPQMQKELEQVFCLDAPLTVVRASSRRRNIVYRVETLAGESEMRASLLGWLGKAHENNGDAALVFCRTTRLTEELCQWLKEQQVQNVSYYHASLCDEEKEHREKAWEAGEISVMVATSAFGTGIDRTNVRVVVHYQRPYSTIGFVQESGRAGRDGIKSWHSVLLRHDWETSWEKDTDKDITLRELLIAPNCRRLHIERYVDGDERRLDCFMSCSQWCDNCEALMVGEEGVETRTTERVAEPPMPQFRPWEPREPEDEEFNAELCDIIDTVERTRPSTSRGDTVERTHPSTSRGDTVERTHPSTSRGDTVERTPSSVSRAVHRSVQNSLAAQDNTTGSAHLIVEFTDQLIHKTCLLCGADTHDTRYHGGRCYHCLAQGHFVKDCTIKGMSWQSTACFTCGLPRHILGIELHSQNMAKKCESKGRDHYVPWVWLTWHTRSDTTYPSGAILKEAGVPDAIQSDIEFKQWLGGRHQLLHTNFVSVLVLLITKRNERDLAARRGMVCKRRHP